MGLEGCAGWKMKKERYLSRERQSHSMWALSIFKLYYVGGEGYPWYKVIEWRVKLDFEERIFVLRVRIKLCESLIFN